VTNFVWYPVTGNGTSVATAYTWDGSQFNWNTGSFWIQGNALILGSPSIVPGAVPGSGGGSGAGQSQGPGQDNVGLVAGDIGPTFFNQYVPDPAHGDPFIASNSYPVDLLINSGTVNINSLLLGGVNVVNGITVANLPQLPTVDVEGATFELQGSIVNSFTAVLPAITVSVLGFPIVIGGTAAATGGGTIDLGTGGTVQVAGSVQSSIVMDFKDATHDLLNLGGVSSSHTNEFAGTIVGFGTGDTIFLSSIPFVQGNTESFNANTLTISNGATTLATLDMSGSYTTASFTLVTDAGGTAIITCFAAGTRIRTARGDVPVEALVEGDRVPTFVDGREAPIVWIGRRQLNCRRHPRPDLVLPVRIAAGAFADGSPMRDLYLSPDHAVFVDGVLIPVKYLIDGDAITQVQQDEVSYYHLQLPRHDVLLAEGLPVESYLDTGNRTAFDNGGGIIAVYPDFSSRVWEAEGCARLVVTGPELDVVKRRLHERSLRNLPASPATSEATAISRFEQIVA
jgi:hypothetical protein